MIENLPEKLALAQPIALALDVPLEILRDRIHAYDGERTWAGGAVIHTSISDMDGDGVQFAVKMGGETGSTGWIIGVMTAESADTTRIEGEYGIQPHLTGSMLLAVALPVVALIGAGFSAFLIGLAVTAVLLIGMFAAISILRARVERHKDILFQVT